MNTHKLCQSGLWETTEAESCSHSELLNITWNKRELLVYKREECSLFIRNPGAIHYVRMKRKFNLHDGSRLSALTACDYAFTNLTPGWSISLTYAAGSCDWTLEVTCIITSLFIFLNSFSVSWNFNYCRRYFLWRQENTSLTLTGILKCVWEYDYAKSVMEMSSRVKQYCVTEVL